MGTSTSGVCPSSARAKKVRIRSCNPSGPRSKRNMPSWTMARAYARESAFVMRPSPSQESANSQLSSAHASRISSMEAASELARELAWVEDIFLSGSKQSADRIDHLVLGGGED